MMRSLSAVLFVAVLLACSSDDDGSTSSGGSSSSSGASGGTSPGGNTCGYASECVAAALNTFCADLDGTTAYQCCKPATPPENAGCTKASGGENESAATYCCTGTP
jgi:hypothetical protein